MDWKGVQLLSFCLLVLCPEALAQVSQEKKTQEINEGFVRKSPLRLESKLKFLAVKHIPEEADSGNISKYSTKEDNKPVFQIETPAIIKKTLTRKRKVIKPSQKKNTTSSFENRNVTKESVSSISLSDSSIPEESKRIEDVRDGIFSKNLDSSTSEKSEEHYVSAHFVPSENFPKIIASNIRQGSSRVTTPFAKGDVKYVLAFNPDSSEELNSRSDSSEEQFESLRNSQGFNGHKFDSDEIKNQIQSEINSNLARNAFPPSEAQKVTIIKEKTIHSTSSEAAQERVNIEKNPLRKQQTNLEETGPNHPRASDFQDNAKSFQPRNANNQDEKIILVEGTHIPGRNYGPEDDTFGFHANSYKEEKSPSQLPNNRIVKIVRVIKTIPEGVPSEIPLNNHGNGESRQYFVNNQQGNPVEEKQFHSNKQHHSNEKQQQIFNNVPQIQQTEEQHFVSDQRKFNTNSKQRNHNAIFQNQQFEDSLPKHSLQAGTDANLRVSTSQHDGGQAIVLEINPDPNELYIDQNTGQLIKFVTSDELSKHSPQNTNTRSLNNNKQNNEIFLHRFPENKGNHGLHPSVQNYNQGSEHKIGEDSGRQNDVRSHETQQNFHGNQQLNQGNDIQYIEIHDDESIHLIIPPGGKLEGQQIYFTPPEQSSGNEYQHSQETGNSNLKDDSEEYAILCDQVGQDHSGEYHTGSFGSNYQQNAGNDNYNTVDSKSQTQGYGTLSAVNHNTGQLLPSKSQEGNIRYDTNSGSRNFQGQKFGSRINNNNAYGNNLFKSIGQSQGPTHSQENRLKGAQFEGGSNKGVTNFATPPSIAGTQEHYKGDEFSNTKHNSKIPVYRETVTPAYPVNEDYNPPTGVNKGQGFQLQQNQENFKQQIGGTISYDNHNRGSGFTNQKEYNSGNKEFADNQGYGGGSIFLSGDSGHNKGTEFSTSKDYNRESGGSFSNQGYDSGEDLISAIKGQNKGSGISKQKEYNSNTNIFSGINSQSINKGSDFSNAKGNDKGSGENFNSQGYNVKGDALNTGLYLQDQNKGTGFTNEKSYIGDTNKFSREISEAGDSRNIRFPNQKGFPDDNSGYLKNQNQNLGGDGYNQGIPFNEHNINAGISNQKGYSAGQGAFPGDISTAFQRSNKFSEPKGYTDGNDKVSSDHGFNSEKQLLEILSLKGDRGDSGFLNQKSYNTGSKILSGNIFSGSIQGSSIPSQKGYNSGSNRVSGNQGFQKDSGLSLYSGISPSKGLNKGLELSNNKDHNSGNNHGSANRGYKTTSISQSFTGSLSPKSSNKGIDFSNQNNYASGLTGNQGYGKESPSFANNKGYHSGTNSFSGNADKNFKGTPIQVPQNNDYNSQIGSDHNSLKGTNFKQNTGTFNDYNKQVVSDHNTFKGISFKQNVGNSNDYNNQEISDHTNFKGTDFKQSGGNSNDYSNQVISDHNAFKGIDFKESGGNSGHSNQNTGGYNKGSTKGQFKGQQGYGNQNIGGHGGGLKNIQFQGQSGYNNQNAVGDFTKSQFQGQSEYGNLNAGGSTKGQFQGQQGYSNQNIGGSMKSQFQGQQGYGNLNFRGSTKGNFQGQQGYVNQNVGSSTKGQFQGPLGYGDSSMKGQFQGQQGYANQNAGGYIMDSKKGQFGFGNQNAGGYSGISTTDQFKGQPGYGNQNSGVYSGGSTKDQTQGKHYRSGNNELGISYLSSTENLHQPKGQDYSANEGPVQYILIQADDASLLGNGNGQGVYLMPYDNNGQQSHVGNNQEQTYLILDDSNLQQHQNVRVMVDGGKDRTFPIRQLATVGLHMARSVIPQIKKPKSKSKAKSFTGKISFGVEIKKDRQSGNSQDYFDSRSDKSNIQTSQRQVPIK